MRLRVIDGHDVTDSQLAGSHRIDPSRLTRRNRPLALCACS
jgi:hypothetical protein